MTMMRDVNILFIITAVILFAYAAQAQDAEKEY
jgi:hypothetical protein